MWNVPIEMSMGEMIILSFALRNSCGLQRFKEESVIESIG